MSNKELPFDDDFCKIIDKILKEIKEYQDSNYTPKIGGGLNKIIADAINDVKKPKVLYNRLEEDQKNLYPIIMEELKKLVSPSHNNPYLLEEGTKILNLKGGFKEYINNLDEEKELKRKLLKVNLFHLKWYWLFFLIVGIVVPIVVEIFSCYFCKK